MGAEVVLKLTQIGFISLGWYSLENFSNFYRALWAWCQIDNSLISLNNNHSEKVKYQSTDVKMIKINKHYLLYWLKSIQPKIKYQ